MRSWTPQKTPGDNRLRGDTEDCLNTSWEGGETNQADIFPQLCCISHIFLLN